MLVRNHCQMLGHRSLQTTQKYMMTDRKTQVDTAELLKRNISLKSGAYELCTPLAE